MRHKTVLPEDARYMTVGQAAELAGVTEQHIYNLCRTGEIKSMKLGRVVRVCRAEFLEQIKAAEPAPAMAE